MQERSHDAYAALHALVLLTLRLWLLALYDGCSLLHRWCGAVVLCLQKLAVVKGMAIMHTIMPAFNIIMFGSIIPVAQVRSLIVAFGRSMHQMLACFESSKRRGLGWHVKPACV